MNEKVKNKRNILFEALAATKHKPIMSDDTSDEDFTFSLNSYSSESDYDSETEIEIQTETETNSESEVENDVEESPNKKHEIAIELSILNMKL